MKMTIRCVMMVLVAVTVVACQSQSKGLTQVQKDAVAASATAVVNTIFEKSNQLDFAGALAVYSGDADARYIENGVVAPSLEAFKQQYAELGPTLELLENKIDSTTVLVLAGDAAAVTVPVHLRIKAKGRPEYAGQYVWSGIVQRRNGTWQLVQSHESWVNADQGMAAIAPVSAVQAPVKK